MDTAAAIDRFLASPSLAESTRRAYAADLRGFGDWLDATRHHGRGDRRPRACRLRVELGRARNGLAPATIARKLAAVRSLSPLHARPDARSRRVTRAAPPAAPARGAEARGDRVDRGRARRRRTARPAQPRPRRARLLGRPPQRRGGGARPRRRRLRAGARARPRQGRQGARRAARRGGGDVARALPARRAAGARGGREDALFLSVRGRRLDTEHAPPAPRRTRTGCATRSPRTCSRAAPTCGRSRSCSDTRSLSTTQVYSHVDARRLRTVYDSSHPRWMQAVAGTGTGP